MNALFKNNNLIVRFNDLYEIRCILNSVISLKYIVNDFSSLTRIQRNILSALVYELLMLIHFINNTEHSAS